MKRKHLARMGGLIAVAALVLLAFVRWTAPRISQKAFDEIQVGMSRDEVEKFLNCPGRKVRRLTVNATDDGPACEIEWLEQPWSPEHKDLRNYAWAADRMVIVVCFDGDDRVSMKDQLVARIEVGLLARIRRAMASFF